MVEPLYVKKIAYILGGALLAATLLVVPAAPASAAPTDSAAESRFLGLLNMARAGSGKSLLVLDPSLSNVSRNWSNRMADANDLRHNPSYGAEITRWVTSSWTVAGENVGVGGSPDSLHNAFWNSIGHRNNVLGDYNRVGIGAVRAHDRLWVTFNFLKAGSISGSTGVSDCAAPGYLLDAFGGIHSVAGAPPVSNPSGYWVGWDIARDISLDATGKGYKLDGYGGLYPLGGAARIKPSGYWNWDVAVAVAALPGGNGAYVLDAFGGIHQAGAAPKVSPSGYWVGWKIARDIAVNPTAPTSGYVLDGFGALHPFGGAPAARVTGYSPSGTARSFSFLDDGTGGYVVDANGGVSPFAVGNNPLPPSKAKLTPIAQANASYAIVHGTSATVITSAGARLGQGELCATPAPWGGWNVIRSAASS